MAEPTGRRTEKPSYSLRERFSYWFDRCVTSGSLGLIRFLIVVSVIFAVLMGCLIVLLGFHEDGEAGAAIWDSIATVINAWMPYYADGGPGYLVLMSVVAVAGVLFTSVLIGIVTSSIEERVLELKKGSSRVLEEGHTVILGFRPGEFTLLHELILAAAGRPDCVVIAADADREDMELSIRDNVEVPKNFRIICRTADIFDPASLERCAVRTCRAVIVHPAGDVDTVRALLAVSALTRENGEKVPVNAILSRQEYAFPPDTARARGITALQADETLARLIAHACTQKGLAETFREIFNFEGAELYFTEIPGMYGLPFGELLLRLEGGVPLGILRDGKTRLAPPGELTLEEGDRLLVFAEKEDACRLSDAACPPVTAFPSEAAVPPSEEGETVILGCNRALPVILKELPEGVKRVLLAGCTVSEEDREALLRLAADRRLELDFSDRDLTRDGELAAIARDAGHIVLLNDDGKEDEEADIETVFQLLRLRELRTREGLGYNITAEMRRERNQRLADADDHTDFVVASSMSSLILAQLAENPALRGVFAELLSNRGCELFLRPPAALGCAGPMTVRELRARAFRAGYILLGWLTPDFESVFNPAPDTAAALTDGFRLIVLGEE